MSVTNETINIGVPVFPESVTEATVVEWYVSPGDFVELDQKLVDLETDKVVLEVLATGPGRVDAILHKAGEVVTQDDVLGTLKASRAALKEEKQKLEAEVTTTQVATETVESPKEEPRGFTQPFRSPSARRVGKEVSEQASVSRSTPATPSTQAISVPGTTANVTERVPMTPLRAKIAERLLASQHQSATLTTFNEVNLQALMELRSRYKDKFEKQHGIRLGFMSLFTKAAVEALKQFPGVNASIEGKDILYHRYYDIGIAVSTDRGLVVPVVRNADQLRISQIEKAIYEYSQRARNNSLGIADLNGGTFTITNGGVFGSLLSTPILNPPQSGILGMHKIEERPIVESGQVVIRPMMYLALSYDHRIIDGKESVQFLGAVKNLLEDPARFLLDI